MLDLFDGLIDTSRPNLDKNHPILRYYEENEELEKICLAIEDLVQYPPIKNQWLEIYDKLKEYKKPISDLKKDEIIVVRTGALIPVDGTVVYGEAFVNESSMIGESQAVKKNEGSTCFAGTAIDDGEIHIKVSSSQGNARIDKILDLIEESQDLKARLQQNAQKMADGLVPYSLALFGSTFALTRNVTKAIAVLMVDYSCAIKLFTPISIISAMREASEYQITVKGGKFLEEFAYADTIVFDKTGTLTKASPHLAKIIPLNGKDENQVLKLAACLEEHFPHSVARAITDESDRRNLVHREKHAKVEYIVAHGIVSSLDNQRVVIGSRHFVEEDEKIQFSDSINKIIDEETNGYSTLYLGLDGDLIAIFCIDDPPRSEAKEALANLKNEGINEVYMLTGDSNQAARKTAENLNIDKYFAQILPDQKYEYIKNLKENGKKVIMVGDGINDSPALSVSNVSVAMRDASDIAKEVADVTLLKSDLNNLVTLRILSKSLIDRIHMGHQFILTWNSALILFGIMGALSPSTAALLHNMSTFGICAYGTRPLLNKEKNLINK